MHNEFENIRPNQLDTLRRAFEEIDHGNVEQAYSMVGHMSNPAFNSKAPSSVKKSIG